jgi:mannose-1-phosphate guanylyltransferase
MEETKSHLFALIFCGGGGTRLWPFSREDRPKQFLKIKGSKSLLRETFERILPVIDMERIYLVTVPGYTDEIAQELPEVSKRRVLVEPARRNTAMAAGLGAVAIAKADPQAIIANIWVDHVVEDETGYRETLLAAAQAAADGKNFVTTGLKPKGPHTGLGYIEKGKELDSAGSIKVYELKKFTEKPKLVQARQMVASGQYLWNVGLFAWRVDTFMEGIKTHSPDTYTRLAEISKAWGKLFGKGKIEKQYASAPDMSIDVALAEKANNFLVVEGKFDWLDVGDFSVLWQINKKDGQGNANLLSNGGEWLGLESKDSLIISEDERMVATYGVSDLIVVSTKDTTLVIPKSEAQKVKKIVQQLKKQKKTKFL